MALSCLILSGDLQEVSVFECVLGSLRIEVEAVGEPAAAKNRLNKSKIDAVLVDCDLAGADRFLHHLRQISDEDARPVVIVSGTGERSKLEPLGAEFVAPKPISVEQAVHTFSAARNLILKKRLRYYRQTLNTPVVITDTTQTMRADLLNLSQKGIRVHLEEPRALRGDIGIDFLLPGTQRPLHARGEVAWTDGRGNAGIRLVDLSEPTKHDLRLWLEQQYFQTCHD